jgi:2,3-bisphosphoglycerate-independent phosphoglycerate mutase
VNPVLMLFLDGVGVGNEDYEFNPFFRYGFKTFSSLLGEIPSHKNQIISRNGIFLTSVDAKLGVEGYPQSGTGQTSIFCGINASKFIGKHFGPYPYSTLIPIIKEKNIFTEFISRGKTPFFANAYPKVFFDYLKSGKTRLSVTSLSCKLSGIRLNRASDVRRGKALTAEITSERWIRKLGYTLPVIKAKTAARRLIRAAQKNDFTLYEYFLTDHLGHGRFDGDLQTTLQTLDEFLFTILDETDKSVFTVIICSDHGNFEDLSCKTHTLNPAIFLTAGKYAKEISGKVSDITQIKEAILGIY